MAIIGLDSRLSTVWRTLVLLVWVSDTPDLDFIWRLLCFKSWMGPPRLHASSLCRWWILQILAPADFLLARMAGRSPLPTCKQYWNSNPCTLWAADRCINQLSYSCSVNSPALQPRPTPPKKKFSKKAYLLISKHAGTKFRAKHRFGSKSWHGYLVGI